MANEINPYAEDVKAGVSVIQINPVDVVEKFGKYQFVYDYSAIPLWLAKGFGLGNFETAPQTVNSKAQVGVFSKGNIVNVVRFQGNNAIIENVNYKEPDSNVVKSVWGELLGGVINKRELEIPKEYLKKVDDALEPTILTGINYGANLWSQPVLNTPVMNTTTDDVLEENASYILVEDFKYLKSNFCPPNTRCAPQVELTMLSGSKVLGTLVVNDAGTFLAVQTPEGLIKIPLEYLTKEVEVNNGEVAPVEIDNKNLLLIVGAFLLGFALFSNNKTQ